MTEKKICLDYDENMKVDIELDDYIKKGFARIERFLNILKKHDTDLVKKLFVNYKETLEKMGIQLKKNDFFNQFNFEYSEFSLLSDYPENFALIENATLQLLDFAKYKSQFKNGMKLNILYQDYIRGTYPMYYLVYSLLDVIPRETVIALAKEYTDFVYELYKDQIPDKETLEDMAKMLYSNGCPKTHNLISEVKDGKYFLKVTRCMWGDLYQELPDLEIAYYLECYGDFSKMPYINTNFVLTRTKTLVEGDPYCDFVHHDKRIVDDIAHPEKDFWENFK